MSLKDPLIELQENNNFSNNQQQEEQPHTIAIVSPNKTKHILTLSIENAQLQCGNGHLYQTKAILITFLQYIACSFFAAGWPLLFENPTIYCYSDLSHTDYYECNEYTACKLIYPGQTKDSLKHNKNYFINGKDNKFNITEQFNLICDRKEWVYFSTQIFILGGVLGSLYYAYIMEKRGRLRVLTESMGLMILASVSSYFCFDIQIFIVMAFTFDFGFRAFNNASLLMICESSSDNLRRMIPSIFMSGWAIGQIGVSIISIYYFNWRDLQYLILAIPLIILFFNQTTLQDSPRFLVIKRRFEEAKIALLNIAKKNDREVQEFVLQENVEHIKQMKREKQMLNTVQAQNYKEFEGISHGFSSLLTYTSIRSKTLSLAYIWGVTTLSYYTLMLEQRKYIEKKLTFHLIVAGVIELVSYLIYMNLSLNYFRKQVIKHVLAFLGIGHLLFFIIPMYKPELSSKNAFITDGESILQVNSNFLAFFILSTLRVVVSGFVNSFLFVYSFEVFPTSVRHFAFGFFTAWTKAMWILAPVITFYFDSHLPSLQPLSFIGIFLLIGVWFVRKLRETQDETGLLQRNTPDYLEEEQEFIK